MGEPKQRVLKGPVEYGHFVLQLKFCQKRTASTTKELDERHPAAPEVPEFAIEVSASELDTFLRVISQGSPSGHKHIRLASA